MKKRNAKLHDKRLGKTTPAPSSMLYVDKTALFQAISLFGAIRALSSRGFRLNVFDCIDDLAAMGERLIDNQIIEAVEEEDGHKRQNHRKES